MTQDEALKEAQRHWGTKTGYLGETGPFAVIVGGDSKDRFRVGEGKRPYVYGWGDSWEAAFTDADRRATPDLKETQR